MSIRKKAPKKTLQAGKNKPRGRATKAQAARKGQRSPLAKGRTSQLTPAQKLTILSDLLQTVAALRDPQKGCPWDLKQTPKSLCTYVLEEAFELVEAIETGNKDSWKDELGDYLFQVVLQAQLASEQDHFDFFEVVHHLEKKLKDRHPHVFGSTPLKNVAEVWKHWHKIKIAEDPSRKTGIRVPVNLPALAQAQKIGVKTQAFEFDWSHLQDVWKQTLSEVQELQEVLEKSPQPKENLQHELGDVLFSLSQLARHLQIDAESCLRTANRRFLKRFHTMLDIHSQDYSGTFKELADSKKQELWQAAKLKTRD